MSVMTSPLARVYADALLQLAHEKKVLDEVSTELESFREVWRSSAEMSGVLTSPRIPAAQKIKVIDSLFDRDDSDCAKLLHGFLGVLAKKGRLAQFESVCSAFFARKDEQAGIARGKVVFAEKPDPAVVEEAEKTVSAYLDKKVSLDASVDPEIVGGVIVQVEDLRLDGSIRRQFDDLRDRML